MKRTRFVLAFAVASAGLPLSLGGCGIILQPPEPPAPCETDEDCDEHEVCWFHEVCPPCTFEDPPCLMPCVLEGVCVDEPPDDVCSDDADCPEGFFCEITDCVAPLCPPGQDCAAICQLVGHCEPILPDCYARSLEECRDDGMCRIAPVPTECPWLDEAGGEATAPTTPAADAMPLPCDDVVPGCWPIDEPLAWPACLSDADCGDGPYRCEYTGGCLPWPCDPGEPCPELCQAYGACRYDPPPLTCDDVDCGVAEHCEMQEVCWAVCGGATDPGEPGAPEEDAAVPCFEECELVPVCVQDTCYTDEACPPGYHCEWSWDDGVPICPEGVDCLFAEPGLCVRDPPPPPWCYTDADCEEGFHCEWVMDTTTDGMDEPSEPPDPGAMPPPPGVCVADPPPPPWCYTDEDCPEGSHCEYLYADPMPCAGDECLWPGPGTCVEDPPPPECFTDEDCEEGFFCDLHEVCPPCVYADPACDMPCLLIGECLERKPPACFTDEDCPDGLVCELEEVCPPCVDEDPPCAAPCWLDGTCVLPEPWPVDE